MVSQARSPALARRLWDVQTSHLAVLIPLYGPPPHSPGALGTQRLGLALPAAHCFPFFPHCSLATGSSRRCCHFYCPCRLSHRPRTTASVAYCGAVGSASSTETLSQLTRLLVSLLLRPQAMLLVPNTFECAPSVQPHGLPHSQQQISRQTVLA